MKDKNKRRIVAKKLCTFALLWLSLLFMPYANAVEEDDILDLAMPAILAATQPISARMTIPINEQKQTTSVSCWPATCVVPLKKHSEYVLAPKQNYKFCAKKIDYISRSANSSAGVTGNNNQVRVVYDVSCSPGGISVGSWNSAVGITAAVLVGVFAGPEYSAGVYDLIQGTATVSGLIGGQLISNGTTAVLDSNHREGACGVGDPGIWLNANVNLFLIRSNYSCPIPDAGWEAI